MIGEHTTLPELEASGPSSLAGSLLYLAPELIEGASMSTASDIYGAGMIAVELLTGTSPRSRVGPRMTFAALQDFPGSWLDEAAVAPCREPRVLALLRRLLARDPERRCSCAAEVAAEIEIIGAGLP